ncbi:MAG: hypothetical protein GX800_05940 [Clostridiaceae bacterium]|nr:hypothetical protein [Clostridiaceae bacterium]
MDFFNEHIVLRKKDGKDYIKIFGMVVAALLLFFVLLTFSGYLASFFLLFVAGIIYLLYFGISSLNIEYEYIVTNGDIDIDKIVAKRKRTRIVSLNARDFEYFAPMTENHANTYNNQSITKRLDVSSNTKNSRLYFGIYRKSNEKTCLIFEPTDKMLECFSRYVPKNAYYTT